VASTKFVTKPESVWRLGALTPRQLASNVVRGARDNDLLGSASGLAFNFLLALFPLMFFLLALFGLFASRSAQLQTELLFYFADFLPPEAFQLLRKVIAELAATANAGRITFGIVLALWFASGGFSSMISALNLAYHVPENRSWLKVRAIALGLTLAISILVLSALLIVLVGGYVVDWVGVQLHLTALVIALWKGLQWLAAVLFVTTSFSVIYFCGPDTRERQWRWLTPGSAVGVLLWLTGLAGFRIYLHFFDTYSTTYGSLGAVMVLLAWLYITALAFLVGGQINAEIERVAAARLRPQDN
jgi:membrane protein